MSRVGKKKIMIPEGVSVQLSEHGLAVSGTKGKQNFKLPKGISASISENELEIKRSGDTKTLRSLHGTVNRTVENIIVGLSSGFEKKLEFKGVGYAISVAENKLLLRVGFSHQISVDVPDTLTVTVIKNVILVEGPSKESVGEFAAKIREIRKPEVYKGKGIKYQGEFIKKKAGKAAQTTTT